MPYSPSRRRFVLGTATTGALLALGLPRSGAAAVTRPDPGILSGQIFDLSIGYRNVDFTGARRVATVVNGDLPAPVLHWREGDHVTLRVTNRLAVDSSIHWHGILLPAAMDGVPGISFDGIAPGTTFEYRFQVRQNGTYWYHSHSGHQEQTGLYGAIVVDPREASPFAADRDHCVVLSDWSDEDPHTIEANLKKDAHYYNDHPRTAGDLWREIRARGVPATFRDRAMWNRMRMSDRDIADVTGRTYTYLMNGCTPAQRWSALFRRGERVRLRFINASAMTFFDVRIPGLAMTVVACDGQYVEPVTVDEFRLGVAETCDVLVEPQADRAWTLFAQAMDRSGYALGTLTADPALEAEVPTLDPPPVLTPADMGMGGAQGHDRHTGQGPASHVPDPHGSHAGHGSAPPPHDPHAGHGSAPASYAREVAPADRPAPAGGGTRRSVTHPASERGPRTDMRVNAPTRRLDDPGPGLRDNGRRVLTYADLRSLVPTADPRDPVREIELHLTGNMRRFLWSIDGIPFSNAPPLHLRLGERVRFVLVNDTMMSHPMHLHGMWSDLETGDAARIPRKHTVVVLPGQMLSHLVTVDAPGPWAWHCHLLYHMSGMFRRVVVA